MMFLKKLLDQITMYRLMLYFLLVLITVNIIFSFLKIFPFNYIDIFLAAVYFALICNVSNYIFAKLVGARTNLESASITALILTLIIGPLPFLSNILTLTIFGSVAMLSKYILAIRKKHIFNPVAIAIVITGVILKTEATWWIGGILLISIIIIGGLLILMKIKKFELVTSFLLVYLSLILLNQMSIPIAFINPWIWFFILVMLVEPLTSPLTTKFQVLFGGFVALVYFAIFKIMPGYVYSLETALLAGNLFTLFFSPSSNIVLEFIKKIKVADNTWSFYFQPLSKVNFIPGQYMEWTYPHKNPDSRGVRRYFSLSSTPDKKYITVTMRVNEKGSSFKKALLKMVSGAQIMASSPYGEFILPNDKNVPLCFIAAGIGITPFCSMIESLLETGEKRDIIMLYSNSTPQDIAFEQLLQKANRTGIKTYFIITKKDGHIDDKMIKEKVVDYKQRIFYLSGPEPAVVAFKKMLVKMKVKAIKTDYFPGYVNS